MTTPGSAQPALEARDVAVTFPTGRGRVARAVDGVNLSVQPGQIVALVGESGCGKSTLARALMGLQKLSAGSVQVQGEPLDRSRRGLKAYRRRVQLVLQDPMGSLNPRMTVYESVVEGLKIHGVDRQQERVTEALSRVGLRPPERFLDRYPHELSGGQRQRVVIAGALVLEPTILVADEPVSSLDASVRGEILALLLRLRDELGLSLLVVTHDLGLAWNIADRIAVMYLGRIIEEGTTEELLANPSTPTPRHCSLWCRRSSGWSRSCWSANPPTRCRSPSAAGSIHAARCCKLGCPTIAARCRGESPAILALPRARTLRPVTWPAEPRRTAQSTPAIRSTASVSTSSEHARLSRA